jgi:hypothetical protein
VKALLLAIWLLLSVTRPRGDRVLVNHVQLAGGEQWIEIVTSTAIEAADANSVPRGVFLRLMIDEGSFRERVTSFDGSSKTIAQLNTSGKYYVAYQAHCAAIPSDCLFASLNQGARALRESFDYCRGSWLRAVAHYRQGKQRCSPRQRDWDTWQGGQALQRALDAPQTP